MIPHGDVAHALVRAASALMPTPSFYRRICVEKSRHGAQESVRHVKMNTYFVTAHLAQYAASSTPDAPACPSMKSPPAPA